MNRGQIFSTDFLFSMIIIILGLGVLLNISEFNLYNTKQNTLNDILKEKSQTAIVTLTNSPLTDCNLGSTHLPYSIDLNKLTLQRNNLKKILALEDNNISLIITIDSVPNEYLVDNMIHQNNIESTDLNVLICDNMTTYQDLNICMSTNNCNQEHLYRGILSFGVGN